MSTSNTYQVRGERAGHIIAGSFGYDGTAITSPLGEGTVVTREAAGQYTVTFDKSFPEALAAVVSYESQTTGGKSIVAQVYSKVTGSIQIRLLDVSPTNAAAVTLTDPETGADSRIHYMVYTRDSIS